MKINRQREGVMRSFFIVLMLVVPSVSLAAYQNPMVVPRLARVATPPSAKAIWQAKHERYMQVKNSDVAALATERAALKADLEATYQAGFLAE